MTESTKSSAGGWVAIIIGVVAAGFGAFLLMQIDAAQSTSAMLMSDWRLSGADRAAMAANAAEAARTMTLVAWSSIGLGAFFFVVGVQNVRRATAAGGQGPVVPGA